MGGKVTTIRGSVATKSRSKETLKQIAPPRPLKGVRVTRTDRLTGTMARWGLQPLLAHLTAVSGKGLRN